MLASSSVMKPAALLAALFFLLAAAPATAQTNLQANVALLPPAPGPHPDLDELIQRFWHDYYGVDGALGFTLSQVRVGRVDLNGDDQAELFLMIDTPAWKAEAGKPFVIATWRDQAWSAIGWGWGDEDRVWSLTETTKGWHSVDAGPYIMRWTGSEYERIPKK